MNAKHYSNKVNVVPKLYLRQACIKRLLLRAPVSMFISVWTGKLIDAIKVPLYKIVNRGC